MADTIDPRDLYSGVDYNVMQWIIERRAALKAMPAYAHATDDVIDEAVLRSYSWPMTISGSTVTEEKFREYSSYLIANNLNTEGKLDSDFENSRKAADDYYRNAPRILLNAQADYKRAKSAKRAANARIFGWNLARLAVPVATLGAIGGGLTAVGSLLTSSAFATMLGGTVGVGLFGLAAVGTVGYIGYKLVKSAIKWLSGKSKAKKAKAIEDKRARLQEFERAREARDNAKENIKLRDKTREKNNLYAIPPLRGTNQRIITNDKNRITQIRSELQALKTGTFDPLKARESSIASMDITAAATFVADINNVLSTGSPSNLTTLENELTTIQNRLANLDKYAGQEAQVAEITNTIAEIRSTLVAPMKTEAEDLRRKAQERYDSLAAEFTGAARTVNSEVSRIRTKFEKMKHYEEARERNLSVVATENDLKKLEDIERNPANADRYSETELYDMLTALNDLDLSKLSPADLPTIRTDITNLKNEIDSMLASNIIRNNMDNLQLCNKKATIIKAANSAREKIQRKEVAAENAINSVEGKISRLAILSTGTDVRHGNVASLTDDELKELIKIESKVNAIDVTTAERKISELQAEIDANREALLADTYSGVAFNFNMADVDNDLLEICNADIEALKDKIQEAKEEQARRARGIDLENAVTAAENAFATISSTLTTFESLLAETDATLQAKSLADLTTYIADIDTQNATISAVNWSDLQIRINNALTAAGGTVDAALQARINAVTANITKVTTALGKYAGKKASAQTIKTAKENEIATVQDLKDRKDDLMARCSDVATKVSSELPNMADHIADPDKMLTDGTDLDATLNSIHTIQREASALRNDLQALKTDINNAIATGVVTDPANITTLTNLVTDIQNEQSKIDTTLTDLAAYEPLVNARLVRGGGSGGPGDPVVSVITEDQFNNIKNNVLARLDALEEELLGVLDVSTGKYERDELTGTSPHTKIGNKRTRIKNMSYDAYKEKTYDEVKKIAERGLKTLAEEVTLTLSGYRAK